MYRNSIVLSSYLLISLILIEVLLEFNTSWTNSSFFIDSIARNNSNESVLNLYYIIWTTFTYLPYAFFTLGLFVTFNLTPTINLNTALSLLLLLCVCYIKNLCDFISINYMQQVQDSLNVSINLLLMNNVNKYHPPLLYLGVWYFTTSVLYRNQHLRFVSKSFKRSTPFFRGLSVATSHLYPLPLALFLGSWWALQEGSWGGWWDSDVSEMLGLLIFLSSITYLHERDNYRGALKSYIKSIYVVSVTGAFYYFVQVNFNQTSHNFGLKAFLFFDNTLFLFESFFFFIALLSVSLLHLLKVQQGYSRNRQTLLTSPRVSLFAQLAVTLTITLSLFIWISFTSWPGLVSIINVLSAFDGGSLKYSYKFIYFVILLPLLLIQCQPNTLHCSLQLTFLGGALPTALLLYCKTLQTLKTVEVFHYLVCIFIISNLLDSVDTCVFKSVYAPTNLISFTRFITWPGESYWVLDSSILYTVDTLATSRSLHYHTLNYYYSINVADAPNYFLLYRTSNTYLIELISMANYGEVIISNFTGVVNLLFIAFCLFSALQYSTFSKSQIFLK